MRRFVRMVTFLGEMRQPVPTRIVSRRPNTLLVSICRTDSCGVFGGWVPAGRKRMSGGQLARRRQGGPVGSDDDVES
jgi:hypothetical protein